MRQALATILCLSALWLVFTRLGTGVEDLAVALGVAALCAVLGARFSGLSKAGFGATLGVMVFAIRRAPDVLRGAFGVVARALAADVTLKPALVRVRIREGDEFGRVAFVEAAGAVPGAIVVDSDDDSMLVHVIDEDRPHEQAMGALQSGVAAAAGQRLAS